MGVQVMESKAGKIKLIVLDVDGTLTDGSIIIDNNRTESKAFNVADGFAIASAVEQGMRFAIITGRSSEVVKHRAGELKINEVHQGIRNKIEKLDEILEKYGYSYEETAYIGDDINDLPAINRAGFTACPKDADIFIKSKVDFVSNFDGGRGAVREFVKFIMEVNGKWEKVIEKYSNL